MAVGTTRVLDAGPARVVVDPLDGGRITSLAVAGVELLGGIGPGVIEHGSFVMVPWAGRIRDGVLRVDGVEHHLPTDRTHPHAGHGLVMDRPWEVVSVSGDALTIRCHLDARWPFPGHVVQELRDGDRVLLLQSSVRLYLPGGGEEGVRSVLERIADHSVATSEGAAAAVVVAPGEHGSDAFSRLKSKR